MPPQPKVKKDIKLPIEFNPGSRAQLPTRVNSERAHEEAYRAWSSIPYQPAYHGDALAALEGRFTKRAPTRTIKRTHESTREKATERTQEKARTPQTLCHVMRRAITNYKIRDLSLPKLLFELRRENGSVTGIKVEDMHKFVCASHLVWEMCSALAQNGDDPKWTEMFKIWEPQYAEVRAQIASCKGKSRFSVVIPPPPV